MWLRSADVEGREGQGRGCREGWPVALVDGPVVAKITRLWTRTHSGQARFEMPFLGET